MKYLYGTAIMAAAIASAYAEEESHLIPTALEMISRASSTSEVLTLNLTNLLILLVLKALIFGFGIFFVGGSTARSAEETSITETDLTGGMCFLMYTSGLEDKLGCIQHAACNDVNSAKQYHSAGKMLYNVHKVLGLESFPEKYERVLNALSEATEYSQQGGDCSAYQW